MTPIRFAAALALLPLAAACNDSGGAKQAGVAGEVDCDSVPPAAHLKAPPRADQTMIGQPIKLPTPPPAVQVAVGVKCFATGAIIARHKHPWQRYVYLETGSVTIAFDTSGPGGKTFEKHFVAGELLVESIDTWHTVHVDATARLVVIDQVPATNPPTNNAIQWPDTGAKPVPGK